MNTWEDGMQCAAGICADKAIDLKANMDGLADADRIEAMAVIIGIQQIHADMLRAIIKRTEARAKELEKK